MSAWAEERAWWAERGITWTDREWRKVRWSSRRARVRMYLRNLWDALRGVR